MKKVLKCLGLDLISPHLALGLVLVSAHYGLCLGCLSLWLQSRNLFFKSTVNVILN